MRIRKMALLAVLALGAALAFGPRALARGRHANSQKMLQRMSKQLNLTDDQKARIKPILDEEATQINALRADKTLARDQKRARTADIHSAAQDKITPILTPDQQQKWEAMKAKRAKAKATGGTSSH